MRIPCSNSKRYLNGADWLVHALHDGTLRETGLGNSSMIVLEMEGVFELEDFKTTVQQVAEAIPFLGGSASRDWTLAPLWRSVRKKSTTVPVLLETIKEDGWQEAVPAMLEEWANQPFETNRDYLCFRVLQVGSSQCYLAMQFDHRLLDAHGAELFLGLLGRVFSGQIKPDQIGNAIRLTEPAYLDHWRENFLSGQAVIRLRYKFLEKPILTLKTPHTKRYQDHISVFLTLAETRQFETQVQMHAGYLMTLPYGLSVAAMVFRHLAQSLNASNEDVLASCSIDQRHLSPDRPTIFFNYFSFVFFQISQANMKDRPALIQSLKEQFYEYTKERFPEKLSRALSLMRILPIKIFSRLLPSWMHVCFGSFNFAFLGQCHLNDELFCGRRLANVFHLPRIPPQSGAGIYFNQFRGRLNMTITLHRGMIDPHQRQRLITVARRCCLEQ